MISSTTNSAPPSPAMLHDFFYHCGLCMDSSIFPRSLQLQSLEGKYLSPWNIGGLADRETPVAHCGLTVRFLYYFQLSIAQTGSAATQAETVHNKLSSLPKAIYWVSDRTSRMCKSISLTGRLAPFQSSTLRVINSLSFHFCEVNIQSYML